MTVNLQNNTVDETKEHLGDFLWWTLSDVKIKPMDFELLLKKENFDPKLCPKYNDDTCLNRILRMRQQRFDGYILRNIINDENEVRWAIIKEIKEPGKKLSHHQTGSIILAKNGTSVSYIPENGDTHSETIAYELMQLFGERRDYLSDQEIRPVLIKLLKQSSSLTVRDSGGVYFIPAQFSQYSQGMFNIIKEIGSSQPFKYSIYSNKENKENLERSVKGTLENELQSLIEEIRNFDEKTR
jgi:hypothetical protein